METDDFENDKFLKKFRTKTIGNMEKLMACVGHKNFLTYFKDKVTEFSSSLGGFNVRHKPLVSPYFH